MDTVETTGLEQVPDDPRDVYEAAKALFAQKGYAEAVGFCEKAESAGVYSADVAAVHSASLMKLRRFDDAIMFLHGMLYYFPNDARLHLNLGTAYSATYHQKEASYEYSLARRLDPEVVGKKVNGLILLRVGATVLAFSVFFVSILFLPHTRWLVIGLLAFFLALNVLVLYKAVRAKAKDRILLFSIMLMGWIMLLIVFNVLPIRL
ncbi:MAG TPA: hypothetical protein VIK02_03020 [Candidatus Anoxymicrobiaceae bacterium]